MPITACFVINPGADAITEAADVFSPETNTSDSSVSNGVTVSGTITRSIEPVEDGAGDLHVLVVRARRGIQGFSSPDYIISYFYVNLSADGAAYDYAVPDVAPDTYIIAALLDDDDASPYPALSDVDLVSAGSDSLIQIEVTDEDYPQDLVLNKTWEEVWGFF